MLRMTVVAISTFIKKTITSSSSICRSHNLNVINSFTFLELVLQRKGLFLHNKMTGTILKTVHNLII